MSKKKTLFRELVGSFVSFSLLIILSLVVVSSIWIYGGTVMVGINTETMNIVKNGEVNSEYIVNELNGWIEKLDDKNNIIEVIGSKKDNSRNYTDKDIIEILNYKNSTKYYSSIETIGEDKYIIKIPKERMDFSYRNEIRGDFGKIGGIVFIILYILILIFVSKKLSKKIKKPINKILDGMNRVEDGEKGVQIDFHTKNELNDLKDNFNNMIVKIEREEELRIKKEEEKNRLLLDLSHDIKTPVSTIKSYSIALKDGLVEEDKKDEYYDIIDKKATRISYLVDEMNNMLKLDNPDYNINLQRVNFSEIIRNTVLEYYNELEKNGVEVIMEIPEKDIYLELDLNLIKRVLNNLMENQIKYNKGDFVRVILKEEKDKIIFKVIDNGNLIDNDTKENLFNPFVRGDEARLSSGGLGLGLSISKKIVEKHGGEIYYSDEGNLNNFIIELRSK